MLQVLNNLITNALKFKPRGGRIAVRAERAETRSVSRSPIAARAFPAACLRRCSSASRRSARTIEGALGLASHLQVHRRITRRADLGGERVGRGERVPLPDPHRAPTPSASVNVNVANRCLPAATTHGDKRRAQSSRKVSALRTCPAASSHRAVLRIGAILRCKAATMAVERGFLLRFSLGTSRACVSSNATPRGDVPLSPARGAFDQPRRH